MALGDIHLRFTWQAWHIHMHSFHVAGVALAALGGLWWRTGFSADAVDAAALCVAGVALGDRRHGTWRHPPSFHVAGVVLGHIHIRFTWQAWHLRHWAGSGGAPGSQLTPWTPRLFAWQAWHVVTSTFVSGGRRGTYGAGRALMAHRVLS